MDLQDAFVRFDGVFRSLENAGESWQPPEDDWVTVMKYLGLFERCQLLIEWGTLDVRSFERLYSFRLRTICNRKEVCERYFNAQAVVGWTDFLKLWDSVRKAYGERMGERAKEWKPPPPYPAGIQH
jgi:hypothetical protein